MTYRNGPSKREKWKTRVIKAKGLSHGTRVFLVHTLAKHMKADGFVSHPRWKLANEAGVSERQVSRYISNAVNMGWLDVTHPGYRSMTAEYNATFPNPVSETQHVSLSEPEKRDANWPALGVTKASRIPARKRDVGRPTTSSTTTRTQLVSDAQSAHPASSLRLSSPTPQAHNRTDVLGPRHLGSFQPGRCLSSSGATPLSGLKSCKRTWRMRADGAGSKSKSATRGAGHWVRAQLATKESLMPNCPAGPELVRAAMRGGL